MMKGDGGPFGAIIVRNGEVLGSGWNQVLKTKDPTAHAEIVAIRDACEKISSYWLEGCHIYVSCEPCPMCLGAIYWARLESLFFCTTRKDAADIGFSDDYIYSQINLKAEDRKVPSRLIRLDQARLVMNKWLDLAGKQSY